MKSKEAVCIPAVMAGQQVRINTDVVDSDIPLLLSKDSMKKARVKLDLEHDAAEILGVRVPLNSTTSGHYCVPLIPEEMTVNDVHTYAVTLHALQSEDQHSPPPNLNTFVPESLVTCCRSLEDIECR